MCLKKKGFAWFCFAMNGEGRSRRSRFGGGRERYNGMHGETAVLGDVRHSLLAVHVLIRLGSSCCFVGVGVPLLSRHFRMESSDLCTLVVPTCVEPTAV